jgi:hypothetical protein
MKQRSKEVTMEEVLWKSLLQSEERSFVGMLLPEMLGTGRTEFLIGNLVNHNWSPSPCFS